MKWARRLGHYRTFFAQLPGNFDFRMRAGDITSRNFAGSAVSTTPLAAFAATNGRCAVTMFKTTSGAYYFNFQGRAGRGRQEGGQARPEPLKTVANTVVIGKSGTGKTVLEMVLLAQAQKFSQPERAGAVLRAVRQGLGRGGRRACDGWPVLPAENGCPRVSTWFQMEPTPNNLTFLEKLVKRPEDESSADYAPPSAKSANPSRVMGASKAESAGCPRCWNSSTRPMTTVSVFAWRSGAVAGRSAGCSTTPKTRFAWTTAHGWL